MVSTRLRVRASPATVLWLIAVALTLISLLSCSANPPYRSLAPASAPTASACKASYDGARWDDKRGLKNPDAETDRVQLAIQDDLKKAKHAQMPSPCWSSPVEHHLKADDEPEYDLFSVEFDDQGWTATTSGGDIPEQTQLDLLMKSLAGFTDEDSQPLHIVIFVHGWHHSAAPDDRNVISFRRLLGHAAIAEEALCLERRQRLKTPDDRYSKACSIPSSDPQAKDNTPAWLKKRRVVGIYLGWRGDSVLGPLIEGTSIWDRKLTAESVALGSAQEFFARMHSFSQDHDCHTEQSKYRNTPQLQHCVDVRVLTIGHSFGGLITYRALAPRLMMGIAETVPDSLDRSPKYAVGFGDLTVLVNPAFEATRFEPLAQAAVSRDYIDPDSNSTKDRKAQLPLLIVATSRTDRATEYAFPIFRSVSTLFERAPGAEHHANLRTIGWEPRYRTHAIAVEPNSNTCGTTDRMDFPHRLAAESQWSDDQAKTLYRGFIQDTLELCDSLVLTRTNGNWKVRKGNRQPPPYMPIWIVQADKSVINGHNDFLNDHFVDFARQVYYTILRDEDGKMDEMRVQGVSP